jgi:hypothetical protein
MFTFCLKKKRVVHIKTLRYACVRSVLEYGAIVWDPLIVILSTYTTYCGRDQTERVQRKFLKYAEFTLNVDHPSHGYNPILNKLGLSS